MFDMFLPSLTLENTDVGNAPVVRVESRDKRNKKLSSTHEPEALLDIALIENPTSVLLKRLPHSHP